VNITSIYVLMLILLLLYGLCLPKWYSFSNVLAHNFEQSDMALFITLIYQARVELILANVNFPSNVSIAQYHADLAPGLIQDALYLDENMVDDTDFIKTYNDLLNSGDTKIYALVVANLVDEILRNYGNALNLKSDPTNMTNMILVSNMSMLPEQRNKSPHDKMMLLGEEKIIHVGPYQSAQLLAQYVIEISKDKLLFSPDTGENNLTRLFDAISQLKDAVDSEQPMQSLMHIVHSTIHPSLKQAFGL
jgi:hypothetical protein